MSATTFGPSKFQNSFVSNLMGMTFFRIVTICKFKGARKNLSILEKLLHVTVHMFLHAKTFIIWNISYFLIFPRLKILFFRLSPNPMCTKQGTCRISLIFFHFPEKNIEAYVLTHMRKPFMINGLVILMREHITKKICGNWKLRRISNQILHKCNKRSHTTQCTRTRSAMLFPTSKRCFLLLVIFQNLRILLKLFLRQFKIKMGLGSELNPSYVLKGWEI